MSGATITQTGPGATLPFNIAGGNYATNVFVGTYKIGLVATVNGSVNYSVQVTCDPTPSPNGNWNEHDVLTQKIVSALGNIDYPITALRLVVNSGPGSVTLGIGRWP